MEKVCQNGIWISREEARFPISNRAFRYGDSLFESFLIQNNSWIFLKDHFQRIQAGAQKLGFILPSNYIAQLKVALSQNPAHTKNGFGRLMLFRNGKGKYTPTENTISWILEFRPSNNQGYELQQKGLTIDLSEQVVLNPGGISNFKTGNSLSYVIASKERKTRDLDDLLLLGPARNIVESTNANIFIRKENRIYTPPLFQGCLAGILRKKFIEIISNEAMYELRLEPISIRDLKNADEVWLTNASSGIRWVQRFRNSNFANHQYSFWLQKLNNLINTN